MNLSITTFAAAIILTMFNVSHAKADKVPVKLTKQFNVWLDSDLWPQARSRGISKSTFQKAFKNITLNLKLPGLVIPGTKSKIPKKQRQSEFGSPGKYFNEKIIGGVIAGGRVRLKNTKSPCLKLKK